MKKIFLAVVAFVVVSSLSAQDKKLWLGGEVGFGVANYSLFSGFTVSYDISGVLEYGFSDKFKLGSGLGYHRMTFYNDITYRDDNFNIVGNGTENRTYHNLRLPIQLKFFPTKRFYLIGGIVNQIMLGESFSMNGYHETTAYTSFNYYYLSPQFTIGYDIVSKESFRLNLNMFAEHSINLSNRPNFTYFGLRTAVML